MIDEKEPARKREVARTLVTERSSRDKVQRQEQNLTTCRRQKATVTGSQKIRENGTRRQPRGGQRTGHEAF